MQLLLIEYASSYSKVLSDVKAGCRIPRRMSAGCWATLVEGAFAIVRSSVD
jgi:hypothetical protein